jgi:3-hydroxyacyl-[acyl-carrier-protein] dehydratase
LAPGNFLPFDRLDYLPATILGIVTHYVEPELRSKLRESANDLRVAEDLGLDSLAMMEVMMRVEDLLPVSISDKELRQLRTLGEIRRYIEQQVTG